MVLGMLAGQPDSVPSNIGAGSVCYRGSALRRRVCQTIGKTSHTEDTALQLFGSGTERIF